jgi:hypothetical protein
MKKIKVFFMGSKLCEVYPYATKWEVLKYKTMKLLRKVVIASFLVGIIYGSFMVGTQTVKTEYVRAVEEVKVDVSSEMLKEKIESLKNKVVDDLIACESNGNEDAGILKIETRANGDQQVSIGVLQFKQSTVQIMWKRVHGAEITGKEAVMVAIDANRARELAKEHIFKTNIPPSSDWTNCSAKHSLDERVKMIKQLEM